LSDHIDRSWFPPASLMDVSHPTASRFTWDVWPRLVVVGV
jgi:hypothetical protein